MPTLACLHLCVARMHCRQPIVGYVGDYDGSYSPQQAGYPAPYTADGMPAGQQQQQQQQYRQQPTGARLKVMRCVQLKSPESKRALLDFGLGVGVDLDRQVSVLCKDCWWAASHSWQLCSQLVAVKG